MRNKCYTYVLTNVRLTGKVQYDEYENIRVRLVPRAEIERLITTGDIQNAIIIAGF